VAQAPTRYSSARERAQAEGLMVAGSVERELRS
jgi:hypothetical protein